MLRVSFVLKSDFQEHAEERENPNKLPAFHFSEPAVSIHHTPTSKWLGARKETKSPKKGTTNYMGFMLSLVNMGLFSL